MSEVTVTYSHRYDKDKIDALESNPNVEIIRRKTVIGDTVHLLPLHLEPSPAYLVYQTTYTYRMILQIQSPSQDALTPGNSSRSRVPKTRGGTKSSRAAKSAQTLKPFWSDGKPKCRKGYRYDFKRKMCVRKS